MMNHKNILMSLFILTSLTACGVMPDESEQKVITSEFSTGQSFSYRPDQSLIDAFRTEVNREPQFPKTGNLSEATSRAEDQRFLPGSDWHPSFYGRTRGRATTSMIYVPQSGRSDLLELGSTGTFDGDPNVQPTASLSVNAILLTQNEIQKRAGTRVRLTVTAVYNVINGTTSFKGYGGEVNRSGSMLSLFCRENAVNYGATGWRAVSVSENPVDASATITAEFEPTSCNGVIMVNASAEGRKVVFKELKWSFSEAF